METYFSSVDNYLPHNFEETGLVLETTCSDSEYCDKPIFRSIQSVTKYAIVPKVKTSINVIII